MANVIEIDSLSKRYGSVEAVRRLDLRVGKGEIFGFLGPNGAGKSLLLRVCHGIVTPDLGQVRWAGETDPRALARALARFNRELAPVP